MATHTQKSWKWAKRRRQPRFPRGYYTLGEKCACGELIWYNRYCPTCSGTRVNPELDIPCECWYCPRDGSHDFTHHVPGY